MIIAINYLSTVNYKLLLNNTLLQVFSKIAANLLTGILGRIPQVFAKADMQNEALNGEDLTETVKKLVSAVADPIKGRKAETADTKVANIAGGKEAVTTKAKAELIDGLDKE